jgi:type II secretory pathway component GspD/PulD (secretin)
MRAMKLFVLGLAAAWAPLAVSAQQQAATRTGGDVVVKTITLRHLSSVEAMQLLQPYVQTKDGGVYAVPNVRAVTIREVPKVFAEMERVLASYDRSPATVTLNFQLIAAENTNTRDPAVAGLDSLLRGVLKYSGYRLLRTTVANASENERVSQALSGDQDSYTLRVLVTEIRTDGPEASVHLTVALEQDMFVTTPVGKTPTAGKDLLSTGVTVPIGHTVVLGAAAAGGGDRALILTVRPQLVEGKR